MPGVYEGGLKVWEASLDLVEHIVAVGIGAAGRRRVHSEPRNDQLVRGEEEGDVSPVGGAGGDDENARSKSSLEQHEGYGEGKKAEEESDEVMPTGRRKQVLEVCSPLMRVCRPERGGGGGEGWPVAAGGARGGEGGGRGGRHVVRWLVFDPYYLRSNHESLTQAHGVCGNAAFVDARNTAALGSKGWQAGASFTLVERYATDAVELYDNVQFAISMATRKSLALLFRCSSCCPLHGAVGLWARLSGHHCSPTRYGSRTTIARCCPGKRNLKRESLRCVFGFCGLTCLEENRCVAGKEKRLYFEEGHT